MRRLLICAGEASGDLYGAELVRHLRERMPVEVFGMGGDRMAAQGVRLVGHTRDMAVVGLLEVLSSLSRIRGVFHRLLDAAKATPPDAAVLIDYPDFNLRLAQRLQQAGVPIVYYVSPQLWAWRAGRIRTIQRLVSRMLVIFPFEESLYRDAGVPVSFVGHPLVEHVVPPADRKAFLAAQGLDPTRPTVALLPGSRRKEVAHNLPVIAAAAREMVRQRPDLGVLVAVAPGLDALPIEFAFRGTPVRCVHDQTHAVLGSATVAVIASGTATVEAALLGTPMVVVYRLSPLTYWLGRRFVRVSQFAMVNLIAGEPIVPELIQADFTPARVVTEVLSLLDGERREQMRARLHTVREKLGEPGASSRAASEVARVLSSRHPTEFVVKKA